MAILFTYCKKSFFKTIKIKKYMYYYYFLFYFYFINSNKNKLKINDDLHRVDHLGNQVYKLNKIHINKLYH